MKILGTAKVDARGRVTLPQSVMEALNLRMGDEVEIDRNGILSKSQPQQASKAQVDKLRQPRPRA